MTRKRTFSLPDELSSQLDRVAGSNVSAYVAEAVRARISRDEATDRIREAYGQIDSAAYQAWVARLGGDPLAVPAP
jgi:metal-responsive CopG/Arc/MetJ family transcriptional regulator